MRDLGLLQTSSESLPRPCLYLVRFPDVKAPDITGRLFQDFKKSQYLLVPHSLVEVLNVEGLAICIFLQSVQHCINANLRTVRIAYIFLHLQDDHIRVVCLEFVN